MYSLARAMLHCVYVSVCVCVYAYVCVSGEGESTNIAQGKFMGNLHADLPQLG